MEKKVTVGPYSLSEKIGVGSFATVYKAFKTTKDDSSLDSIVAIKAIDRQRLNKKLLDAMESEIEILERVRHVNIVRLFGWNKTKQHVFLILEFCAGGDLHHYIQRQGALSSDVSRHFLRELAKGLEVIWKLNYIHRDLKPHNLLLSAYSPTAQLKIADFGFARHLSEAALADTMCGSPLYMAPEILKHKSYDAKADLWAVGTILFEMLVGKPPFSGAHPQELLKNIETTELRIPSKADATPDAVDLLRRLLRRNPTERISFREFFESRFVSLKPSANAGISHSPFDHAEDRLKSVDDMFVGLSNESGNVLPSVSEPSLSGLVESTLSSSSLRAGGDEAQPAFASRTPSASPPLAGEVFADARAHDDEAQTNDTWDMIDDAATIGTAHVTSAVATSLSSLKAAVFNRVQQRPATTVFNDRPLFSPSASMVSGKPPLAPMAATSPTDTTKKIPIVTPQKRTHASGRAQTFAIQVGERAVHLAKLADRLVEAYEEFEGPLKPGSVDAAAAGIVVESIRLLSLAYSAAEDAQEAIAVKKNRRFSSGGTASSPATPSNNAAPPPAATLNLMQELRGWLVACRDKAERLLRSSSSSTLTIPNPKIIMYRVALGLGRRAAGRELLLADDDMEPDGIRPELTTVVEDYSLGLMLLQLLTASHDLKEEDRKIIHGYLSLFHSRLESLDARMWGGGDTRPVVEIDVHTPPSGVASPISNDNL